MTNTKFRRRALISSVAMLLVALVALGSATFAWFTSTPSVSADGIKAYGVTSTGLEIKTDTDPNFGMTAKFLKDDALATGATLKLLPAYLVNASTAYQTFADDQDQYEPGANATWTTVTPDYSASNYDPTKDTTKLSLNNAIVYKEAAYIATTDNSTKNVYLTGVHMEAPATAKTIQAGATVAVAKSDGTIIARYKLGTNAMKSYTTNAPSDNGTVGAADDTNTTIIADNAAPNTSATSALLGQAGGESSALTVYVLVYLDGTDQTVKTRNAVAAEILKNVTIKFSTANPYTGS